MFIDDSVKDSGRFLFWSWELWQIGGGGGVQWKFLKWEIDPGKHSLLWVIFDWQRGIRKYFTVVLDRNFDRSIGFGLDLYTHRHVVEFPYHFHISIVFLAWFIEFQFGRDVREENK